MSKQINYDENCADKADTYRYILNRCYISGSFYKDYLRHNADKYTRASMDKLFRHNGDDESIQGYVLELKSNHKCYGNYLWFLDNDDQDGYYIVLTENVNTSSGMAMCMSCMFEEDEEDEEKMKTLREIQEITHKGFRESLVKILDNFEKK